MKFNLKLLIRLYIAYTLAMDSNFFLVLFGGLTPSSTRTGIVNNPVMFAFTGLLVGGSALLFIPVLRRSLSALLNNPWFFSLYIWDTLSFFWTKIPGNVVRGMATVWAYLLCALITSYYLTALEQAKTILQTTLGLALISIAFQMFHPLAGTAAPGWTGCYGEKNHLGVGMAIGIICLFAVTKKWTFLTISQLLIFTVLLGGSQSATAMGAAAIAFVVLLYIKMQPRLRPLVVISLVGSLSLVLAFVPGITEKTFKLAGKSTNLTGRDVIWAVTLKYWEERPILGYGAYSFWETEDDAIRSELHWNPREAHNGFLEVLVTDGAVGVVMLLGILSSGLLLARRTWRTNDKTAALWFTLITIALLVEDVTEADFMVPGLFWYVYGLAYFTSFAVVRKDRLEAKTVPVISTGREILV